MLLSDYHTQSQQASHADTGHVLTVLPVHVVHSHDAAVS